MERYLATLGVTSRIETTRLGLDEVGADFIAYAPLRIRQRERQRRDQTSNKIAAPAHRLCAMPAHAFAQLLEADVMREQFLERESPLRGMRAR